MRRVSSGLFLGALFVFTVSCGSDKDDNDSNTGTGGASAGATSAGTAGSTTLGGSSFGGSTSSGGASTGGNSSGAGGAAGKGNFGCPADKPEEAAECKRGGGSACTYDDGGCVCVDNAWDCYSDADCPATAPADAATCALGGMACTYDTLNCTCSTMNGWTCSIPCPSTTPADETSCRRPENQTCRYANGAIVQGFGMMADTTCACTDEKFSCFSEADCPTDAPEDASACTMATLDCEYDDRECTCTNGEWACQTDCPESLPSDGTECIRPAAATCRYLEGTAVEGFGGKSDATCACEDGSFSCFGQEDCPATGPATGDACEFATLSCEYTGLECECEMDGTWTCVSDCPEAVPAQDAACSRPEQAICRYNDGALAQGFGAAEALCACREQKFDCLTEADCPAAAPEAMAECADLTNLSCSYSDQRCTCGMDGWSCQTECPAQLPADGAACMRPATSACFYASGAPVESRAEAEDTCVCASNAFQCYSAADCPAAQPTNSEACEQPGLECAFGDQNCRCRTSTNTWSCMMAPPSGGSGGTGGTAAGSGGTGGTAAGSGGTSGTAAGSGGTN